MKHVCESLGEELNSEKCKELKAHLEKCEDCQDYFKSVELTIDCYKKYNVELPEDAHNRLMSLLGLKE
jgi:predicted anti-sigma-YlaC factor YlaD